MVITGTTTTASSRIATVGFKSAITAASPATSTASTIGDKSNKTSDEANITEENKGGLLAKKPKKEKETGSTADSAVNNSKTPTQTPASTNSTAAGSPSNIANAPESVASPGFNNPTTNSSQQTNPNQTPFSAGNPLAALGSLGNLGNLANLGKSLKDQDQTNQGSSGGGGSASSNPQRAQRNEPETQTARRGSGSSSDKETAAGMSSFITSVEKQDQKLNSNFTNNSNQIRSNDASLAGRIDSFRTKIDAGNYDKNPQSPEIKTLAQEYTGINKELASKGYKDSKGEALKVEDLFEESRITTPEAPKTEEPKLGLSEAYDPDNSFSVDSIS